MGRNSQIVKSEISSFLSAAHFLAINYIYSLNRGSSAIGSDATAAQTSHAITAIAAYSKGFAMALGRGLVYVFDRTEDKSYFRKSREIKVSAQQSALFIWR